MYKIILVFVWASIPLSLMAQCKDTTRANPYVACESKYQPVCGCDNVTYRNKCAAIMWGGVIDNYPFSLNWTDGICPGVNFDFDFVPSAISSFSQNYSDSYLHIFINERLLPAYYSVYIFDLFNKLMFDWYDVAKSNNMLGQTDWGTPVPRLSAELFAKFPEGVYLVLVSVNGEQKTKKIVVLNK